MAAAFRIKSKCDVRLRERAENFDKKSKKSELNAA